LIHLICHISPMDFAGDGFMDSHPLICEVTGFFRRFDHPMGRFTQKELTSYPTLLGSSWI
jgi:hypothetical protein